MSSLKRFSSLLANLSFYIPIKRCIFGPLVCNHLIRNGILQCLKGKYGMKNFTSLGRTFSLSSGMDVVTPQAIVSNTEITP